MLDLNCYPSFSLIRLRIRLCARNTPSLVRFFPRCKRKLLDCKTEYAFLFWDIKVISKKPRQLIEGSSIPYRTDRRIFHENQTDWRSIDVHSIQSTQRKTKNLTRHSISRCNET